MITVNDKWLRIALPAIPSSFLLYDFIKPDRVTLQANIVYIITVLLVCEGSRYLTYRSRAWFKAPYKRLKRLAAVFSLGVLFVSSVFIGSKVLRNYISYGSSGIDSRHGFTLQFEIKEIKLGFVGSSVINAVFTLLVLFAIYELAYHFARLRHTEKERDRLEKEKLQVELQQLKGIVNPHFLFNNLNSLSSLISENPVQAEAFLDELTKVFRYLLRTNETVLTTLAQELEFMDSYYHLLQTRYGKAVFMEMAIETEHKAYLVPPLTLQLLVENAVKHNRVSKTDPLRITLFSEADNRLVVSNNLSLREHSVDSTGIGLRSICSRYNLLNHPAPIVQKDTDFFRVIIPLIPPGHAIK